MSKELFDYIKRARESGMTPEQIDEALVKHGWTESQIKAAFNRYYYVNPKDAPADWGGLQDGDGGGEEASGKTLAALNRVNAEAKPGLKSNLTAGVESEPEDDERAIRDDEITVGGVGVKAEHLPFLGTFLFAAGLIMMVFGYSMHRQDAKFMERAQTAAGTVISIEAGRYDPDSDDPAESGFRHPDLWLARGQTLYRPNVKFDTPMKENLTVSGKWREEPDYYAVNQRVEVLYDPDDISDRRINAEDEVSDFSRSVIWFGVGLLALGSFIRGGQWMTGQRRRKSLLHKGRGLFEV